MENKKPHKGALARTVSMYVSRKREIALLLLLVSVGVSLDFVTPFVTQHLIDTFTQFFKGTIHVTPAFLFYSGIGILVATVLSNAVHSYYDLRLMRSVRAFEMGVRLQAYAKYVKLHALFHHETSSGQTISKIDRGTSGIINIFYNLIGSRVYSLITLIGITLIFCYKQPILALVVLFPIPLYVFVTKRLSNVLYEREKSSNEAFEALTKFVYDVASNVFTVKKFLMDVIELTTMRKLMVTASHKEEESDKLSSVLSIIQTLITTTGRLAVIVVSGLLVIGGKVTIGEFVLYLSLANMAYGPLSNLSYIFPALRRNTARLEKLFEILDEEEHVTQKPNAGTLPRLSQSVRFDHVTFRYREGATPALSDISITIPAGKTIALVGRSGSGKTTFANLLLRSFDPTEGSILFDEHDLRDVTKKSHLSQIAVVPQEVDLFSRTIFENIAYGKEGATQEDVEYAAKTALAHDFIMRTENGYQTVVGERGLKLSGGERQRIGIARAVLRDPKLLILDEATSHLDTESEKLISEATNAIVKNRTTFIIAHRLSTVTHADMIIVFDRGQIESVGTHQQLIRKSPVYKRLSSLQFTE